ncbi:hypothetical protein Cni_G14718 [Canna indica]|uniref:Protein EARLY HEADING DATE 2 n=1 Tax=Canna indica TaxID=4628 RepID=A0AAQ3KGT5_9LILI|nr:hypothetical protein Cni_G14718 [Canna indica]
MASASASSSSMQPFFGVREDEHRQLQVMQQQPSSAAPVAPAPPPQTTAPVKKRRNLPGNPYPDAEVIALSPRTLLATNRFVCEVCNKGFQREQNLQLHRRGHNLPWKLRQKSDKDQVRRRVYLCPEPTCVHHDPSRALGDLTGIKKHFCRKHGEKKWKCDKCSKRYAVQSDWKAHSKICGTREYRCDCGTLFSRRDSFITHRAFCDALSQDAARLPTGLNALTGHVYGGNSMALGLSQVNSQIRPSTTDLLHLGRSRASQFDHIISHSKALPFAAPPSSSAFFLSGDSNVDTQSSHVDHLLQSKALQSLMQLPDLQGNTSSVSNSSSNLFNLSFFSNNSSTCSNAMNKNDQISSQFYDSGTLLDEQIPGAGMASRYSTLIKNEQAILPQQLSATELLQKAAQIGATASAGVNSCLLGGINDVGDGYRSQMENETQMQYLMNSLAGGGGINGLFGSSMGMAAFDGGGGRQGQENALAFGTFMDDAKYNLSSSAASLGGSEGLTRDFLGVGSMQHQGIDLSSLDPDLRSGSSNRSFTGGSLL